MIAHFIKLVWNRRRANFLITVEILVAFLVLAAVGTLGAYYLHNYRQPLGYAIDDVWCVQVNHGVSLQKLTDPPAEVTALMRPLLQAARELPDVVAVAGATRGPYTSGYRYQWSLEGDVPGAGLMFELDEATDDFARVFGLELVRGRWFGKEDDGGGYRPAVITRRMAEEFFGVGADPLGRELAKDEKFEGSGGPPVRIVGVISAFRQQGELGDSPRYLFKRHRIDHPEQAPYNYIFVKVRPGTSAATEEALEKRLHAVAKGMSFDVKRLDDMRARARKQTLAPVIAVSIVAAFLMLMVALGLTGVVWQNVTQRTREIGLRRAKGATRGQILGQILGELMVMTSLAVAMGVFLLAHIPFFDLLGGVSPVVYAAGMASAAVIIYALTLLCGLYPARLASRVQPALALHQD
jgi:putative ABC transport system permease protein